MKRFIIALMAVLLMCVCACGEDGNWLVSKDEHWKVNANGEMVDLAAHELADGRCTGCGALVDVVDGITYVLSFDAFGNVQDDLAYTPDGECFMNFHYERTYSENGLWESDKAYRHGVLENMIVYGYTNSETGEGMHPAKQYEYAPDGSYRVFIMDVNGSVYAVTDCNAAGEVLHEYAAKMNYGGNTAYDYSMQMWDGEVLAEEVFYCFDENGAPLIDKYYEMGVLVREDIYTSELVKDFYMGYISESITYHEDGTKTVVYFDEFGRVIEK